MARPKKTPLDAAMDAYAALDVMERAQFKHAVAMAERLNAPKKPESRRKADKGVEGATDGRVAG